MKTLRFLLLFVFPSIPIHAALVGYGFPIHLDYKAHFGHRRPYHHSNIEITNALPDGCEIVQMQALVRHGARNPTKIEWPPIANLTEILLSKEFVPNPDYIDNPFAFIPHWKPVLQEDEVDRLCSAGRVEAFSLGESFAERYSSALFNDNDVYKIEHADSNRVFETAKWFSLGFWGINASDYVSFRGIKEDPSSGARSLQQYLSCPNFEQNSEEVENEWMQNFLPQIRSRLNVFVQGYSFTDEDIVGLFEICVYDEIVSGRPSPFCDLFTPEEYLAFEYMDDIHFQQFDGPANNFSRILGAPWVQRMAERLRSDSSEKLYFSFGHDVTILPVLSALDLFPESYSTPLDGKAIEWFRRFRTGNVVPFCANLVVEKLRCPSGHYVRVLNNQIPIPLQGCGVGPTGFSDGSCEVEAFLTQSGRKKAVDSGVDWFESECGLKQKGITWQKHANEANF